MATRRAGSSLRPAARLEGADRRHRHRLTFARAIAALFGAAAISAQGRAERPYSAIIWAVDARVLTADRDAGRWSELRRHSSSSARSRSPALALVLAALFGGSDRAGVEPPHASRPAAQPRPRSSRCGGVAALALALDLRAGTRLAHGGARADGARHRASSPTSGRCRCCASSASSLPRW